MVRSRATTAQQYLDELPPERRAVVAAVRKHVLQHLPKGYEESMTWGMITYEIPLSRYPKTYNGLPLGVVALAAQKNYYALYLMACYATTKQMEQLEKAYARAGKKLDMGKCCLRFKRLEDLELDAIGKVIADVTMEKFLAYYEASRAKRAAPSTRPAQKKTSTKRARRAN